MGLVYKNTNSAWASAPLEVPKKGPEKFRFTVDLRALNDQTEKIVWPMPNSETVLSELQGDTCFASFDLCEGYWQLPSAEETQECESFLCPDGVYTPTRVLHGQCNAVAFIQSTLSDIHVCDEKLSKVLLRWLDDVLAHCKTLAQLMQVLKEFFQLCRKYNLKLHSKKCEMFLTEVNWCGRLINSIGVRLDPKRLSALMEIKYPENGGELQQFVCAALDAMMYSGIYNKN